MAVKPQAETILETYSLKEILDLAKEKEQLNKQARLSEAQRHVSAISQMFEEKSWAKKEQTDKEEKKEKRQPVARKEPTSTGQKQTLADHILDVLGYSPLTIDEILEEVQYNGWETKSKDPKRIVYLELRKLSEKGPVKKVERGKYTMK